MTRVALFVGTRSYRVRAFLDATRSLGFDSVVVSDNRAPLASEATLHIGELDRLGPVDGVVAADDWGVASAARLAEARGLPGHTPSGAAATLDKRQLRRRLTEAGLAQPERPGPGPWIVKPVDRSAGEGVVLTRTPGERDAAVAWCHQRGVQRPLIETFVAGPEVIVEGVAVAGVLHVVATFDKPGPRHGPTFPETMLVSPSDHEPEAVAAAAAACTALGLSDGPVHVEVVIAPAGPVVIEVHGRSIGGRCSSVVHCSPSLEELIVLAAVGRWPGVVRQPAATGVYMLPVPAAGRLTAVNGVDAARRVTGITGLDITAIGQVVTPLPERGEYLGFVYARAATPAAVEVALRQAVDLLEPVIATG